MPLVYSDEHQTMPTPSHLLTVLTPDKRGIIAGITAVLDATGGRLLELSQTVVCDYFTIIVAVELSVDADTQTLIAQVEDQVASGASVTVVPYQSQTVTRADDDRYMLTAMGQDSPGLVQTISSIIAQRGGNFTDFSSRVSEAEISMMAEVNLPSDVALDQLQIDLQHATAEAGLQVRLQHQRLFEATNEIVFRRVFHDEN